VAEAAIVGTWRMKAWETRADDGRVVTRPLGELPIGYLTYTADGRMAVTGMASARPKLGGGVLMSGLANASPEAKAAALDTYLSYCGAYSVEGDRVTHHIEVSWWPDLSGTDIVRIFSVSGCGVVLSSDPFVAHGVEQRHVLEWERV
jgi:hypothetical protein